jgi:hypothetical protein
MKSKILFLIVIFLFTSLGSNANALSIETSASGTGDGTFQSDEYSYLFRISDDSNNNLIYNAILTNTSPEPSESLIDLLAFNMDADLGTDFSIVNIDPNWTFSVTNNAVQFDYVGDADSPFDRLNPEWMNEYPSSLTFSFLFSSDFQFPDDPFSL